jgi:hypothetical protein
VAGVGQPVEEPIDRHRAPLRRHPPQQPSLAAHRPHRGQRRHRLIVVARQRRQRHRRAADPPRRILEASQRPCPIAIRAPRHRRQPPLGRAAGLELFEMIPIAGARAVEDRTDALAVIHGVGHRAIRPRSVWRLIGAPPRCAGLGGAAPRDLEVPAAR